MQENRNSNQFLFLDGLRGFLLQIVMAYHFTMYFDETYYFIEFPEKLLNSGYQAMRLFFVISGFLIFNRLSLREKSENSVFFNFYIRRFFRIMPSWIFIIAVYTLIFDLSWQIVLANISLTFGFYSYIPKFMPVIQSWSMFVEEIFYILTPFLFRRLRTYFSILVSLCAAMLISINWHKYAEALGIPSTNYFIEHSPLFNFQYFFFGILLFQIYKNSNWPNRLCELVDSKSHIKYLLKFVYFIFFLISFEIDPNSSDVYILALSLLLFFDRRIGQTFFNSRFLVEIGRLCYPIYLIHILIMIYTKDLFVIGFSKVGLARAPMEIRLILGLSIVLTISYILSWLIHHIIEVPAKKLGISIINRIERSK